MFSPFFLHSENMQDVLITIAEAKCDVEYSNKTYIICMTNAHTSSGWAPVCVNIRSIGMARLVKVLLGIVITAIEKWGGGGGKIEKHYGRLSNW